MKKSAVFAVAVSAMALVAIADDISKFDVRMALDSAVTTNGIKWIDGRNLPIEGRPFDDVEHYYDRLPANVTTNVNAGVRDMKHHTSGMQFRFVTDSANLTFRWTVYNKGLSMDHMPASGKSGIDIYALDAESGKWKYVKTGRIGQPANQTCTLKWTPGTACLVNLPLYNGLKKFELGIDAAATISAPPPRRSGVTKPAVFYGTSITHGGCASRPGLAFVNILGRDLDIPVVNEGYSGCGRMELEMSEHLARIDASCYVLDCIWNMNNEMVKERYEPFIRNLRRLRPDAPIVMAEWCDVYGRPKDFRDQFIRDLYDRLIAEGWKNLHYLPKDNMYSGDGEGTVDGCHPNDIGMVTMAKAYGAAVRKAIGL